MRLVCLFTAVSLLAQDPREIMRKSVELDQANWRRMKDYTWVARLTDRRLDDSGKVKSQERDSWETVVLYGQPFRRMLERKNQQLEADEQRKEQEKLDRAVAKLERESPEKRRSRLEKEERERVKEREFLREIPELYDFHLEGSDRIDGREVWVISALPKAGYQPKRGDAKPLLKIRGRIWIDKAQYEWVKLEAVTTGTITYGLFLARLNAGARLEFEQGRVNDEIWLPKRMLTRGAGRLGLVKKLSLEEELTWSGYRKFQAESKVIATDH